MAARDYEAAPASDRLGLDKVIAGLVGDLEALRAGSITVNDAIARSMIAKQIFNGVRLYLTGTKMLSAAASEIPSLESSRDERATTPSQGRHHE